MMNKDLLSNETLPETLPQDSTGEATTTTTTSIKTATTTTSISTTTESSLIWKQGDTNSTIGSVLVKLAQHGYTREAHQIIGLSHTASLIGRDSIGGLPELWDVMGSIKGKGGITRLMAICICRGSLSPQRGRALIRDHNADALAQDDYGRTALHYALGVDVPSGFRIKNTAPINDELIYVLLDTNPEAVYMKDKDGRLPFHSACEHGASFKVVYFIYMLYPSALTSDVDDRYGRNPINLISSATLLVVLIRENTELVNEFTVEIVSSALSRTTFDYFYKQREDPAAFSASVITELLTDLARNKFVKVNASAVKNVAKALENVAMAVDTGAISALTDLLYEKTVKANSEALHAVVDAFCVIAIDDFYSVKASIQTCIIAGTPSSLLSLFQENIVKEDEYVLEKLVNVLEKIASIDDGKKACVDAGAEPALLSLYQFQRVKMNKKFYYQPNHIMRVISKAFQSLTGIYIEIIECDELVNQLKLESVKSDVQRMVDIVNAIMFIASTDTGIQVYIDIYVPSILASMLQERRVKEDKSVSSSVTNVLAKIVSSDPGIQACIDANVPSVLLSLLRESHLKRAECVVNPIFNVFEKIASTNAGVQAFIDANAPSALVSLLTESYVKEDINVVMSITTLLMKIAYIDAGIQAILDAGASTALIALFQESKLKENEYFVVSINNALVEIASTNAGIQACLDANVPTELIALFQESDVKDDEYVIKSITNLLMKIASTNAGIQAFIDANAPSALVSLLTESIEKEDNVVMSISKALTKITFTDAGSQARVDANAPSILENREFFVAEDEDVTEKLVNVLEKIASIDDGKKACVDAGAEPALLSLYQFQRVKMNKKFYYQPNHIMRVISKAFQSLTGIYIEIIECDELVNQLKLESVKSDVQRMVDIVNAIMFIASTDTGIQACIDANAPSIFVLLFQESHLKENKLVVNSISKAITKIASSDVGKEACIESGVLSVLKSLYQESIQNSIEKPRRDRDKPVIVIDTYKSIAGDDIELIQCIELVHQLTLESVKSYVYEISFIINVIEKIASSDAGIQACIDANAPSVLVSLLTESHVRRAEYVVKSITNLLMKIASIDAGIQACIDANAPSVLVSLLTESHVRRAEYVVKSITNLLMKIASIDAGIQACIDANVISVSIDFLCEKYDEKHQYFDQLHIFFSKIALSDIGERACLAADIPLAMRSFRHRVKQIEEYNHDYDDDDDY